MTPASTAPSVALPPSASSPLPPGTAPGTAPALLEVHGLAKHYGNTPVFQEVYLSVGRGEVVALLGESGVGKSTLLNCIAGLDQADVGTVRIAGHDVGGLSEHAASLLRRTKLGFVFQAFHVLPHLSVADNVAFGVASLPPRERGPRVQEMLDLVGLAHAARRAPHQLSGGQQQRVALARALAPRPRLLLLDEPFSSLDVDLRERLAQEVRAILKDSGTTALLVTHDQLEAFAVGDVIGVMNQGVLEQWDDAYTLYHRPATRFVADFIGHGVFSPATLVQRGNNVVAQTPLGDLTDLAECPLPASFPGGECDVLLRADDVVHDDHAPVQAQILRKSFRGSEFLYTLRLASGHTLMAHVPSHHNHAVGEWIGIRAQVDHVVTFARV